MKDKKDKIEFYVTSMPEHCTFCPCCKHIMINAGMDKLLLCQILHKFVKNNKKCPLKLIRDYNK
ncbi:hypothetical protein [uncultured Clostridium sp.]|uniref:hypothetical protein n=1 Tax=uncultured Clostridium sp. TaxID=59620 RepID=UPI002604F2CD|nr:hypothetical protein [uncultured Clostridium sp.]